MKERKKYSTKNKRKHDKPIKQRENAASVWDTIFTWYMGANTGKMG